MDANEVVNKFMDGLERGQVESLQFLVADDFQFVLPNASYPIGKFQIFMFIAVFRAAFPDLKYNLVNLGPGSEDDTIKGTIQITGTHSTTVEIPGFPPIPPTHKALSFPEVKIEFTEEIGQISELKIEEVPGGSIMDFLKIAGVQLPGF